MGEASEETVRYRRLATDSSLLAVFFIGGAGAFGSNAVPVALPRIGMAFGLSETQIGLVMSAFAFAGLLSIPVTSVLADLYGRKTVVIPALVGFGLAGLATLWVTSYPLLLGLRVIQGVAYAGTVPLTATLIGDLYTMAEGSAAQGIRSGINGLAGAISPLVAGVLTATAWQYPFLLFALAFPAAGIVYVWYDDPIEPRGPGADDAGLLEDLRTYWRDLWAVADERFTVLVSGGFVLFFQKGGLKTFLPVLVVSQFGASVTIAGVLLGVYGGVRVIVSPLSGAVMAQVGRRHTVLIGAGLTTLSAGAIPFAPGLQWLGIATAGFALGEALLNPVLTDAVASLASGDQRAGVLSGLQFQKQFAVAVAPVLLGVIISGWGYRSAFGLAAVLGLGYVVIFIRRFRPQGTQQPE